MSKARKRFLLWTMLAMAVCLTAVLGVINGALWNMAAEDADHLTQTIADNRGFVGRGEGRRALRFENGRPVEGVMGTDSPETQASLRYFTARFDAEGNGELIAYSVNSVSREEALTWAKSLLQERSVGWSAQIYRYRVWTSDDQTFVAVIDQGRELLNFYRVLRISLFGWIAAMLGSFALLSLIARRLFKPLEEMDRTRAKLLDEIDHTFRMPLTVMNVGIENLERRVGTSDELQLLRRQLSLMTRAVRDLPQSEDGSASEVSLKQLAQESADACRAAYEEKGLSLTVRTGDDPLNLPVDGDELRELINELLVNALKYAGHEAVLSAERSGGRIILEMRNDTTLSDGEVDQVFDRHVRLGNADGSPGVGLGLSRVRDLVRTMNGRVSARVSGGQFVLRVHL